MLRNDSGVLGNDSGMTREYLGNSGRVQDMTPRLNQTEASCMNVQTQGPMTGQRKHTVIYQLRWRV